MLPIDFFCILDGFHNIGDADGFLPYHNWKFVCHGELPLVDSEGLWGEDLSEIFVAEEDVGGYIVVGVLIDTFEDGWVLKGEDLFGGEVLQNFVAFYFLVLVEAQAVEASQVGSDEFFTDAGTLYFGQIAFEEFNLNGLLYFGEHRGHIFFKGVDGFVLPRVSAQWQCIAR